MFESSEFVLLHTLFSTIVESEVGGELPLPADIQALERGGGFESPAQLQRAHRWLALLDLCLAPALFRTGVQKQAPDERTTRALIRYLVSKERYNDADRDRLDWLLTYVFKREDMSASGPAFSVIRQRILDWMEGLPRERLSEEAQDLLSQVAAAVEEITELQTFDQLAESRLIQRGRELKESLKEEFFHPEVLPAIVNYNLVFGRRFDQLFSKAASQARELAAGIIEKDYRSTGGDFRKLSEAVKRDKRQPGAAAAAAAPAAAPLPAAVKPEPAALPQDPVARMKALGIDSQYQQSQLDKTAAEIGVFVRAAGRTIHVVPMPHGNLKVAEWESAAFTVEYPASEKTYRAEFSRTIQSAVACMARMREELGLYQQKRASTEYLWKAHYDALVFLLYYGQQHLTRLEQLAVDTRSRGLLGKADNITKTMEKLREFIEQTAQALQ